MCRELAHASQSEVGTSGCGFFQVRRETFKQYTRVKINEIETDYLLDWFDNNIAIDKKSKTTFADLYTSYSHWARSVYGMIPQTKKAFGSLFRAVLQEELATRRVRTSKLQTGRVYFLGVRFRGSET